jgi:hypothetical protein
MQVLDDGLHQFVRNENRNCNSIEELIEKTKKAIEYWHSRAWVFLGIGSLNAHPYWRYTIGSVFRFGKSKISENEINEIINPRKKKLKDYL